MKNANLIILLTITIVFLSSCTKQIDSNPESNSSSLSNATNYSTTVPTETTLKSQEETTQLLSTETETGSSTNSTTHTTTVTLATTSTTVKPQSTTTPKSHYDGNSLSNVMQGGLVVSDGTYHYYALSDGIYKRKINENTHVKIYKGYGAEHLSIYEDTLYFSKGENAVFKVDKDGKNLQKVASDCSLIMIYGNELYCRTDKAVLRLQPNGKELKKYILNKNTDNFIVYKNFIYYLEEPSGYEELSVPFSIYKVDIKDGKTSKILSDKTNYPSDTRFFFTIAQDNIYYTTANSDMTTYKIKKCSLSGTSTSIVSSTNFFAWRGWQTYTLNITSDGTIYKNPTADAIRFPKESPKFVLDGWIYEFDCVSDWDYVARCKLDGSFLQILEDNDSEWQ